MPGKRRVGRPRIKESEPPLVSIGLRVSQEMKDRLEAEAEKAGRSVSQEAAMRVSKTFRMEDGAADEIELTHIINLLQAIRGKTWREDPETRRQVMALSVSYFARNAPKGFEMPNVMELYGQKETLDLLYRALETGIDVKESKQ